MRSPFSNGSIRQQEIANRNHARQVITRMLAIEAARAAVMVAYLIDGLRDKAVPAETPEALWSGIINSDQLVSVRRKADDNVAAYPEFSGWVNGKRAQIERTQKDQLRQVLNPIDFQRRFGNCPRLQKLHFVSPARV